MIIKSRYHVLRGNARLDALRLVLSLRNAERSGGAPTPEHRSKNRQVALRRRSIGASSGLGVDVELKEYETMFAVEDRHWWYVGMQRITLTLMAQFYPGRTDLKILDAGCGTGAVMDYLAPFGAVTGFDLMGLALHFCRQRGLASLNQAAITHLPFVNEQFDLVTSFDVLCHRTVGDYRHALLEFRRVLKPGGRLFLRLPAYDWLQAHHDQVVHTVHRFNTAELQQALTGSGLTVEKLSYANTLLFPVALGKRLIEWLRPRTDNWSDVQPNPAWQDRLLARFLLAEAHWLTRRTLPFGLTVMAVARKPRTH